MSNDATRAEEIRSSIAQTREQMSEALDAIQEKLRPQAVATQAQTLAQDMAQSAIGAVRDHVHPQAIAEQVSEVVREVASRSVSTMANSAQDAAKNVGSSLLDKARQNPIPLALIGLGVGLFVAQAPLRRAQGQVAQVAQQAQGTAGQIAERAQDTTGQLVAQAQDAAGQVVDQARAQASQLGAQVGQQAAQAGTWLQDALHANPLAVGATALAVGAIIGLMLPETPQEHQLMGKTRDALVERVQTAAQAGVADTLQKAQRVAEETQAAAQRAAREQGLLPS